MKYVLGVLASLFACQAAVMVFVGIGSGAASEIVALTALCAIAFAVAGQMLRDGHRRQHAH
jgi:hypothetical protein